MLFLCYCVVPPVISVYFFLFTLYTSYFLSFLPSFFCCILFIVIPSSGSLFLSLPPLLFLSLRLFCQLRPPTRDMFSNSVAASPHSLFLSFLFLITTLKRNKEVLSSTPIHSDTFITNIDMPGSSAGQISVDICKSFRSIIETKLNIYMCVCVCVRWGPSSGRCK